ncbi:MAG: hypothetical protein WC494_00865 [Candidatus Pacearchaeota archaeon]
MGESEDKVKKWRKRGVFVLGILLALISLCFREREPSTSSSQPAEDPNTVSATQ